MALIAPNEVQGTQILLLYRYVYMQHKLTTMKTKLTADNLKQVICLPFDCRIQGKESNLFKLQIVHETKILKNKNKITALFNMYTKFFGQGTPQSPSKKGLDHGLLVPGLGKRLANWHTSFFRDRTSSLSLCL